VPGHWGMDRVGAVREKIVGAEFELRHRPRREEETTTRPVAIRSRAAWASSRGLESTATER